LKLDHVFWIGGSTCSGKSESARRIAAKAGSTVYPVDEREPKRVEQVDPARYPLFTSWAGMSADERWVQSSVEELVVDTLALCGELVEMIVAEVGNERSSTIVEGFQPLPELVARVVPHPRAAVFLVATPEFRRSLHYSRPHAWAMPSRTSDPDRAQRNRLERDDLIAEHIAGTARALDLKTIAVDGTRPLDEIAAEAQAHLELPE
jgi:hypothetical protein